MLRYVVTTCWACCGPGALFCADACAKEVAMPPTNAATATMMIRPAIRMFLRCESIARAPLRARITHRWVDSAREPFVEPFPWSSLLYEKRAAQAQPEQLAER